MTTTPRHRVVVVGGGFGGLPATRLLSALDVDVTLIDRRNHHLFQPLLYQVATAGLNPGDVAYPVGGIVRRYGATYRRGALAAIDSAARVVKLADGRELGPVAEGESLQRSRIYQGGNLTATVSKHFTFLKSEFTITVPGSDDLEAVGQFNAHAYTFTQAGRTVAEVSKRWCALTDTYGVDIAENEDDLLILAGTVVIDMVCHPDHQQNQL